jgi:hypothetical protein
MNIPSRICAHFDGSEFETSNVIAWIPFQIISTLVMENDTSCLGWSAPGVLLRPQRPNCSSAFVNMESEWYIAHSLPR